MKKLMALGAIAVLVGSLAYMIFATPAIPLLDANRNVLAESARQGFCAGQAFRQNQPNAGGVQECMKEATYKADDTNLEVVQINACEGVGTPAADLEACAQWLKDNQYWVTMEAQLTNAWNGTFPYPLSGNIMTRENDQSRTGDRDENSREGLDRN